jgi:effector-binding domain-containing protein
MKAFMVFLLVVIAATSALAQELEFTTKNIYDKLIASIRFQGQYEEIASYMENLFQNVSSDYVCGDSFTLYHDDGSGTIHDMEVCVPVTESIETDIVHSRMLPGGDMLTVQHHGSFSTLGQTWQALSDYATANNITLKGPEREVYLYYDPQNETLNIAELQVPIATE